MEKETPITTGVDPISNHPTNEQHIVDEKHTTATPVINEKHNLVEGNEPYDATIGNMKLGEFAMNPTPGGNHHEDTLKDELVEEEALDLYQPFPINPNAMVETRILSIRAVVTGMILGSLVSASNLYLGLRTGFTFSSTMFGAIFGYGIVKSIAKFAGDMPLIGGPFGPQENSIIQASAMGSAGIAGIWVAGLPAMYRLDLMGEGATPQKDIGKLFSLTLICSFFGLFFVTPLRRFFVIQVGRELNMLFPTPTAVALTIKAMHATGAGARDATSKLKAIALSFTVALVQRITSYYAIGILYDWHVFTWFYIWSGYKNWALNIENWGWYIEWTPAFIGSGMLIGLNPAISMFTGSFLAWGLIGPLLVHYGTCIGIQEYPDDPKWGGLVNFYSLSHLGERKPSPRFWLLWPGVMIMVCCSLAELFIQYKIIWIGMKSIGRSISTSINDAAVKRGKPIGFFAKHAYPLDNDLVVKDPARPEDQVKTWMWVLGLLVTLVVAFIIGELQWQMNVGLMILACFLGFFFAFLAIQIGAVTDQTPLTAASKASQLIFGAATHGHYTVIDAQRLNLLAGGIASGAADNSMNLVSDFRTGFLLRTPPIKQFAAQAMGTIVSVFLVPGLFVLFTKAYPCITNTDDYDKCAFLAPSVTAWAAVAQAVTDPKIGIPKTSGIFSCVMGAVSVIQVIVRHYYLIGERAKYRAYLPNWGAIALSFVIPVPVFTNASLIGAIVAALWRKYRPAAWELYGYAVAAGFIAGEGLGGVVGAALTLGGVSGDIYGTQIGCPALSC